MTSSAHAKQTPRASAKWWRERWVAAAALIALLQIALFWVLSPTDAPGAARPPSPRDSWAVADGDDPRFEEWLWLMSPAVFFTPSRQGFSGAAWLRSGVTETEIEQLTAPSHPMPHGAAASVASRTTLLPRREGGLASQWRLPPAEPGWPAPPPAPWPERGRARILSGLEGWRLAGGIEAPTAPGGPAPPVVVRVTLDPSGGLASPPLIWEGSGSPAADEAALAVARSLRFARDSGEAAPSPREALGGETAMGLVVIEWAAPAAPTSAGREPS